MNNLAVAQLRAPVDSWGCTYVNWPHKSIPVRSYFTEWQLHCCNYHPSVSPCTCPSCTSCCRLPFPLSALPPSSTFTNRILCLDSVKFWQCRFGFTFYHIPAFISLIRGASLRRFCCRLLCLRFCFVHTYSVKCKSMLSIYHTYMSQAVVRQQFQTTKLLLFIVGR